MTGLFGRKQSIDVADKDFVALSFYLAGAAEMASVVLGKKEDAEVKEVGRVLGALSSRFFDPKDIQRVVIETKDVMPPPRK